MTDLATLDPYGALIEPATYRIKRLLPGPIDRVWAYLTDSDLRRQWLAEGDMTPDAPFTLTWRNDKLSPGSIRPEGMPEEHSMESRIVAWDPPHLLIFTWHSGGEVTFELEEKGPEVLLTVVHRRLSGRSGAVGAAAGWHVHLDLLVARLSGKSHPSYWDTWTKLKAEYDTRLPPKEW
jgi:uncharacterized protein YndB with AHSA1/START domain